MLNSDDVKRIAQEVGFDACGIARADALTDEEYPLRSWLAKGWHAGLSYMERNIDMRMDPRLLVPGARSVICCVSAYPPPSSAGGIAAYARTREYHKVIKDMLHKMLSRLGLDTADGAPASCRQNKICCDTVPISDKHWAARAGLGFIGRHTLLVTPQWGTWVNLGEIVTTEECTEYTEHPEQQDFCSHCHRCVDACPNHAIAPDGPPMIDVSRCTAYYTTHHSRPIPPGHITAGYTQGCDLCQLACPHNGALFSNK